MRAVDSSVREADRRHGAPVRRTPAPQPAERGPAGSNRAIGRLVTVTSPDDPREREAEQTATRIAAGRSRSTQGDGPVGGRRRRRGPRRVVGGRLAAELSRLRGTCPGRRGGGGGAAPRRRPGPGARPPGRPCRVGRQRAGRSCVHRRSGRLPGSRGVARGRAPDGARAHPRRPAVGRAAGGRVVPGAPGQRRQPCGGAAGERRGSSSVPQGSPRPTRRRCGSSRPAWVSSPRAPARAARRS